MPRKKPGPKTEQLDGPLIKITVLVDKRARTRLEILGDGNLSKGVRKAARIAYGVWQR